MHPLQEGKTKGGVSVPIVTNDLWPSILDVVKKHKNLIQALHYLKGVHMYLSIWLSYNIVRINLEL